MFGCRLDDDFVGGEGLNTIAQKIRRHNILEITRWQYCAILKMSIDIGHDNIIALHSYKAFAPLENPLEVVAAAALLGW